MRLDKFLCKCTELDKTQAIALIKQGNVRINQDVITSEATQVHENNLVTLYGTQLIPRDFRYILMHKPAGTICSNIDEAYPSVFNDLNIENPTELHIAGRLDADTTGLILITDDGRWSYNITSPNQKCSKVYRAHLTKDIKNDVVTLFKQGIKLQGEKELTLPATLEIIGPREVILTLTQGKFHQVKRMFAAVGNRVKKLHREQIGEIKLDVNVGEWRYLTAEEVEITFRNVFITKSTR